VIGGISGGAAATYLTYRAAQSPVITKVNDQVIDAEHPASELLVRNRRGDRVKLTLIRNGKGDDRRLTLGQPPQ
jgi:S1-C subfamily serine protease